ncbi:hypothetical protein PLESTB_000721900 [Pleodorina starrii]|uniref:SnoaL-like domain-containing protein n=1 Tax=Pleodorina starrii TaxID=330485 RepID=A0A9W6BKG2_9CHLO|nr:hypothetical protein PLESTM_001705600 [Pleodorina starrii]GLC53227.1 hypothetical protein PLESTB_000721900 [Pleodorina starrii]GLC68682.1 hypothetical protein PLESTF_000722500 [Pleodorina starrii]
MFHSELTFYARHVRMLAQPAYHTCSPARPWRQTGRRACQPTKVTLNPSLSTESLQPPQALRAGADDPRSSTNRSNAHRQDVTRRQQLALIASAAIPGLFPSSSAAELETSAAAATAAGASPAAQALEAIRRDFVERQYYVTGDLSRELFAANCTFKDPTVEVVGVEPYVRALQTLFDPTTSRADLISIRTTAPDTVVLRWRLGGSLKLGGLKIKPYTGTTVYTISDDGKVVRHEETWDISTVDAFVSTFLPGFGAPPAPPVAPESQE